MLTRDNIVEVIKFAHREKLFIFADEVSHCDHKGKRKKYTNANSFSRFIKTMFTQTTENSIRSRK